MILGMVVKFFYLALCKIRPEVEYLFNEVYLYYTMFIVFLLFSFLPSFLFFWSVLGFFCDLFMCGWKNSSVVKNTSCSWKGPRF